MAWEGSDRKYRLPADWPRRRAVVLKRDGYQCTVIRWDTEQRCPQPATDVDHIVPGDDHSYENLRACCSWHHSRKSSKEGNESRWKRPRAPRKRPSDRHPGDLT